MQYCGVAFHYAYKNEYKHRNVSTLLLPKYFYLIWSQMGCFQKLNWASDVNILVPAVFT